MKSQPGFEVKVDVVPIINVSLVIVLTLMIISPFLDSSEHPVDLPQANASEAEDSENIEITYTLDGEIWVDEQLLQLSEVQPYLRELIALSPHSTAVVKADRAILYGDVERLIAEIELAEAAQIALATRQHDQESGE